LDNNQTSLDETILLVHQHLGGESDRIQSFQCDVTDASSVQRAVDKAVEAYGTPHLLWNNAGYQGQIKPTLDYSTDDFATVMNINVTGMFIVLQTVAKYMAAAHEQAVQESSTVDGHNYAIVNTASVAALRGTPAMVAYSASKAAVLAMTVASAKGKSNVFVVFWNYVVPALE
jgi:NAD(P)-dependent dehydrogenase (short-subunit alcohol dehydrogenase family)